MTDKEWLYREEYFLNNWVCGCDPYDDNIEVHTYSISAKEIMERFNSAVHTEQGDLYDIMMKDHYNNMELHEMRKLMPDPEALDLIFQYDPICGLQYSASETQILVMDTGEPTNFDVKKWKRIMKKSGIQFLNSKDTSTKLFKTIYSNLPPKF